MSRNPTLTSFKPNSDPDVRAFMYEQSHELMPFVEPGGSVRFFIKEPTAQDTPRFTAVAVLEELDRQVTAEGVDADVFEAIKNAKEQLLWQMLFLQLNEADPGGSPEILH